MVEGPPASNDDNAYKNNDTKQSTRNTHAHTNTKQQREDEKKTKWRLWKIALQPFSASFSSFFFSISEVNWIRGEQNECRRLRRRRCILLIVFSFFIHSSDRSVFWSGSWMACTQPYHTFIRIEEHELEMTGESAFERATYRETTTKWTIWIIIIK